MKVSILIPVRNEEKVLPRLLRSLQNLDFDDFEILIGNDQSTDQSGQILEEFKKKNSHVKIIDIVDSETLFGKTNALAQLASQAKGEFWLFTDADMELPKSWIKGMLTAFEIGAVEKHNEIGVVVGLSSMKKTNLWTTMQGIEWLQALTFMKLLDKKNIATTAMGNNMAIRSSAYYAVGGYENINFSIVEDYALYKAMIERGIGHYQSFDENILGWTLPPAKYFEQRKRWIAGAVKSKSSLILGGFIRAFSFPIYMLLAFICPQLLMFFLGLDLVINLCSIAYFENKLSLKGHLIFAPLFTIYVSLFWFLQFLYFILPTKLIWKDRRY